MSKDTIMRIRLPDDLKDEIAAAARKNLRSLNAQVVFMLRERVTETDQPTT